MTVTPPWMGAEQARIIGLSGLLMPALVLAGLSTLLNQAQASDIVTATSKVSETFENDSNPLLLPHGAQGVSGFVTTPELRLNADFPTIHSDLGTKIEDNRYNQKGYNSTDLHVTNHDSWKGEVWSTGLDAGFDYDTTRTSELGTGSQSVAGIRHRGLSFSGNVGANLTQTDQLLMQGTYLGSDYDDASRYTNYQVIGVTPSYQHSFTPLNAGLLTLQASHFSTTSGPPATVDTVAPMVGWIATPTQRLSLTATVGVNQMTSKSSTTTTTAGTKSTKFDAVFGLDATYKGVQDLVRGKLTRTPTPQPNGQMLQTTSFTVTERHSFSPTLEVNLNGQYQITNYSGTTNTTTTRSTGNETAFMSLSPSLVYHVLQDVDLNLTYRYRQQLTLRQETAQSNAILVTISFAPGQKSLNW